MIFKIAAVIVRFVWEKTGQTETTLLFQTYAELASSNNS